MSKFFKFSMIFLCLIVCSIFSADNALSSSQADVCMSTDTVTINFTRSDSGVALLNQDNNGMTVKMDVGSIDFIPVYTGEGIFIMPRIKDFSRSFKVGEPMLPIASRLIDIPYDCKLKVQVMDSTSQDVDLKAHDLTDPIMPVQPSLSKSQDPRSVPFEYNRSVYQSANKYALALVSTEIVGILRSTRVGRIAISPIEYDSANNTLKVYTSITVRIKYKNANWNKTNKMKKKHRSPYFDVLTQQFFLNTGSNSSTTELDSTKADLVKYPVKYAIVSDRMFESQLQPFIEWKTKKGFNVVVGYTDTIGTGTTAIKNWIEGLYNAGTPQDPVPSFVLFVGDVQQIPAWSGSAGSHITDLRYCEFTGDDLPEIYYGLFSAQNTSQLQPQIDKTLEYEQYTMPDPSYLGNVTLVPV